MILGVDFDGTIVTHMYPDMGRSVPGAIDALKRFIELGHRIILWTMRSGAELEAAVKYLEDNGIALFGVNENPEQPDWTSSPKAYCHKYIDDSAVGCPLLFDPASGRPYVDWSRIDVQSENIEFGGEHIPTGVAATDVQPHDLESSGVP